MAALVGFGLWARIRSPWLRVLALGAVDGAAPFLRRFGFTTIKISIFLPRAALALNSNVLFCLVAGFHIHDVEKSQTSIDVANAGRSHPHDRSRSTFPP